MSELLLGRRIFKNADARLRRALRLFHLADGLGLGETLVHHVLVVVHEAHFFTVLRVEVILAGIEIVFLFRESCGVRLFASLERSSGNIILTQAAEESVLARRSAVLGSEATVVARDVSVPAAAVIRVDDGLRVNVGERLCGSFLLNNKSA